jgi:hypothetical protein
MVIATTSPPTASRSRTAFGDGACVEGIQDQRHALSLERLRLLIELDRVGPRDLLDGADVFIGERLIGVLGILYDIHGNLIALDAVLAEAAGVDRWLLGGDYCVGSPWPHETLERLRGLPNGDLDPRQRRAVAVRTAGGSP